MSSLSPANVRSTLVRLGQFFFETRALTIWERDTRTLPRYLRKMRHRYRDFAQKELSPLSLQADLDPSSVDVKQLFVESAAQGFQTEFMPFPWGTLHVPSTARSILLQPALKAEEFCAACGGLGLSLLAHELGVGPLFLSGDLKSYFGWLGKMYREINAGQPSIAAFAITEPGAGSDVEETEGAATAKLSCRYLKVPGGYRVSGRKCFISDGAVARWITLFAAETGSGIESWTCFLIDSSMQGFSVGRKERKMGQRAADASELVLDDVFVPDERVIGGQGAGWALCRNVLNYSRPVVGAIALGIARGAYDRTVEFCKTTRLNGRPLTDYQDVQLSLSDMMIKLSAMRATVWQATRYPLPFQAAGSIAKVFCSDMAWEVCNQALDLLGNHGFVHSNSIEKAARDARLTQIYEGTNQINRLGVYESQLGAEFPEP